MSTTDARVEVVHPTSVVREAGNLLRAAWSPPSLHYSDEFLAWQFGFPGGEGALAATAWDAASERLIGFAAVTPRRMRVNDWSGVVYALSYVAAHPSARGRGIAAAVYAALLEAVDAAACPVLTFAQPQSGGERAIRRAYPAAGYRLYPLGECQAWGAMVRPSSAGETASCQVGSVAEMSASLGRVLKAQSARDILWADPDDAELVHYARDPRTRRALLCGPHDNSTTAAVASLAVAAEMNTARGVERTILLECLAASDARAADLRAMVQQAATTISPAGRTALVTIPNATGLDPTVARAAGLRRLPSSFVSYWCVGPLAQARLGLEVPTGTNAEII